MITDFLPVVTGSMTIEQQVISSISDVLQIPSDQITSETKLPDLGADSLDLTDIVLELEERFNVQIPETMRVDQMSIREIATFIGGITE